MLFIFLVLGFSIDSIYADTSDILLYESKGMIITATGYKKYISDVSSSVSIITEDDIRLSNSYITPDILEGIPGLTIMKTGNFGRADILIRGIGDRGRRLGVLVDGRNEKMSIFGCSVTQTLPLHNVKKVEIVKGPLSSLYGSGAMGGVINIITREPDNRNSAEFISSYGSYNTYSLTGSGNFGYSSVSLSGSVQRSSSDGHLENSKSTINDYQGSIKYEIGDNWRIKGFSGYTETFKEIPATVSDTNIADAFQEYRRGSFEIAIGGEIDDLRPSIIIYRTYGNHEFSDGWESRDRTDGIKSDFRVSNLPGNMTVLGLEYRKQYGNWIGNGEWQRNIYEGYIHSEQEVRNLNLTGGIRYTRTSTSEVILSYDGGLVFKFGDSQMRMRAGRGFRLPSLSDLYLFPISNEKLEPEELTEYEIGFKHRLMNRAILDISLYTLKSNNFMRFSPQTFRFENIDTLSEKGMEISLSIFPLKGLMLDGGFSFVDRGERTRGIPGRSFNAGIVYRTGKIEGTLKGRYVTDYYAEDNHRERIPVYLILETRLNFNLYKWASLSFGVNNILDEEYVGYVDTPDEQGLYDMPGTNYRVGLVLKQ